MSEKKVKKVAKKDKCKNLCFEEIVKIVNHYQKLANEGKSKEEFAKYTNEVKSNKKNLTNFKVKKPSKYNKLIKKVGGVENYKKLKKEYGVTSWEQLYEILKNKKIKEEPVAPKVKKTKSRKLKRLPKKKPASGMGFYMKGGCMGCGGKCEEGFKIKDYYSESD